MAFTMKMYTIRCCEELSAEPDETCNTDFCETQVFPFHLFICGTPNLHAL